MKKIKLLPLVLVLCLGLLVFSGCGSIVALKCYSPASDASVIAFYSQKVGALTKDSFTVSIQNVTALNVPTATGIGGPKNYADVPNGQTFYVEIAVNSSLGTYMIYEVYEDEYTLNGKKHEASSTSNYANSIPMHKLMSSYAKDLPSCGVNDFCITEDKGDIYNDFAVFLYCQDYDAIYSALQLFKNGITNSTDSTYHSYGVYIFTDKAAYDSIDLSHFGQTDVIDGSGRTWGGDGIEMITGKDATRIGSSKGDFDKELFATNGAAYAATDSEYQDYQSFDYVVFWAYAEPNTQGICDVQLFGVK